MGDRVRIVRAPRRGSGGRARLRARRPHGAEMSGKGSLGYTEMMSVERAAAKNTLVAYTRDPHRRLGLLGGRGRDLADASAEDVEAYFTARRAVRRPPPPRRRAAVRQFYRFVLGEAWRADDPSRRVEAPRKGRHAQGLEPRRGRPADRRGRRQGWRSGLRLACMVELAYASGLRDLRTDRADARGARPRSGLSDRQGQAAKSGSRRPTTRRGQR